MHIMNFMTIFCNRDKAVERKKGPISRIKSLYGLLFILPLLGLLTLSGCEEDPSRIGDEILLDSDLSTVGSTDTIKVNSYTSYFDKIKSFYTDDDGITQKPSIYYLGCDYSSRFGLTEAGFISQLWLAEEWPKDHVTFDSLILRVYISSVEGNLPEHQVINVYEIDKVLSFDSTYYINDNVPIKQFLGGISFNGLTGSDTIISIKLPVTFINELMRDTTQIFLSETPPDFRNYFCGLYFEYPQTENYHMVRVNLNSGFSGLNLYYTDTADVSKVFSFLFNSKTVSYNLFSHDFEAAEPDKEIRYINEEIQDTVSYIQNYNGVYTTLRMAGLESLKDSLPLAINRARLYLPAYSNDTDFPEDGFPSYLLARYVDEEGNRYITRDYEIDPLFADGQYYSFDKYFKINISAFVQDYLEPGSLLKPELEIIFNSYDGNHLILWGEGSDNPPRLELVYTKM